MNNNSRKYKEIPLTKRDIDVNYKIDLNVEEKDEKDKNNEKAESV